MSMGWWWLAWILVVVCAADEPWECQHYVDDQDDKWCQNIGTVGSIEHRWFGPDSDACGICWCCQRFVGPTSTETSSLTTTVVTATGTHTVTSTETTSTSSTSQTTTTATTTTKSVTTTTFTTTTFTTTTITQTTTTVTTTTTSTSTSTTGPHMFGGNVTKETFLGWLSVWRSKYSVGLWKAGVPDPWESMLPKALKGIKPEVVKSSGGVAGGIVTEGMGYGIMIEGFLAAQGDDYAFQRGLALTKSWLGMVAGPVDLNVPLGGGGNFSTSSTEASSWPYGISAIEWSHHKLVPAGVPAWKFPIKNKYVQSYVGSAADGDQDAILGMVYLASALNYPLDFVDMTMRSVISFASADLGFPDMYRTLPDGTKIFVPKLGSMWGGLTPPRGSYKANQEPWCYSPGYFAPAHYRTFRDFAKANWREEFKDYLPNHLNNRSSSLNELLEAFESAVTAGYNILHYSSCSSGTVSNWVGVQAPCSSNEKLNCPGVPWKHTPYVGPHGGTCQQSGTKFGSFGADASRAAWRLAMDYVLFREESSVVTLYDRDGKVDPTIEISARSYLNRIVIQYDSYAICDGGKPGDCMKSSPSPFELAYAFDPKKGAPNLHCAGVPNPPESWWAGFMSYPTFAAFVAPYDEIGAEQMKNWMDTFASICDFTWVNKFNFNDGLNPKGNICLTSYFEASQAVIALMVMSDNLVHLPHPRTLPGKSSANKNATAKPQDKAGHVKDKAPDEPDEMIQRVTVLQDNGTGILFASPNLATALTLVLACGAVLASAAVIGGYSLRRTSYTRMSAPVPDTDEAFGGA